MSLAVYNNSDVSVGFIRKEVSHKFLMCKFPPFTSNVIFTEFLLRLVFLKSVAVALSFECENCNFTFQAKLHHYQYFHNLRSLEMTFLKYFHIYKHVNRDFTACSGVANPSYLSMLFDLSKIRFDK